MKKIKFINKPGFTLLELMVVVVIVAILSTVAFVAYEKAKVKSRDTQRKMDLAKISLALTGYFADNRAYLDSDAFADVSTVWGSSLNTYLPSIPTDPKTGSQYQYRGDAAQYKIIATSEGITTGDSETLARSKAGDYFDSTDKTRLQVSSSVLAAGW